MVGISDQGTCVQPSKRWKRLSMVTGSVAGVSEKKLLQIQKLEKSHLPEVQQLEEF